MPVFFLDTELSSGMSVSAENKLGTAVHFEATADVKYSRVICTYSDPSPRELMGVLSEQELASWCIELSNLRCIMWDKEQIFFFSSFLSPC